MGEVNVEEAMEARQQAYRRIVSLLVRGTFVAAAVKLAREEYHLAREADPARINSLH